MSLSMILKDRKLIQLNDDWNYGFFHSSEFKLSQVNGENVKSFVADGRIIRIVNFLRRKMNTPVKITSFGRTAKYNASIGGAKNSYHLITSTRPVSAIDSQPLNGDIKKYKEVVLQNIGILKSMGLRGVGFYNTFIHLDTGSKTVKSWGTTSEENKTIVNTPIDNEFARTLQGMFIDLYNVI